MFGTSSSPNDRSQLVHKFSSFLRRMMRPESNPHVSFPSLKRNVVSGIAISTVQPVPSILPDEIHGASRQVRDSPEPWANWTKTDRVDACVLAAFAAPSNLDHIPLSLR